jgi:hypothetical protein
MSKSLPHILLLLGILFSNAISAQMIFIGSEQTNRKLQWSDFKGRPDESSPHHAVTTWYLSYEMENVKTYGDSIHVGKLNAILKMEPKDSWSKADKQTDELLKHEQGHFYLGILCLHEFMNVFSQATFTKSNFDAKMKQIFQQVMKKYIDLSEVYDKETEHGKRSEVQAFWDNYFSKSVVQ